MLTAPLSSSSSDLFLAQGLPSSPVLAFLCYKSLFDYVNELCSKYNIKFTLYVDDMTFSSKEKIPQEFINQIMGLLKSKQYNNRLTINKKKTRNYKKQTKKKITGVYINGGIPNISSKKHFELFVLYSRLIDIIHNELLDIDSYFEFYNLFLKFSGNLIHLFQVEHNGIMKSTTGNYAHDKMVDFYKSLIPFVKPGLIKKDKNKKYSKENLREDALKIAQKSFLDLTNHIKKVQSDFPKLRRDLFNR